MFSSDTLWPLISLMGLLDRCCLFEKPVLSLKHLSYTVTSVCVEQGDIFKEVQKTQIQYNLNANC